MRIEKRKGTQDSGTVLAHALKKSNTLLRVHDLQFVILLYMGRFIILCRSILDQLRISVLGDDVSFKQNEVEFQ